MLRIDLPLVDFPEDNRLGDQPRRIFILFLPFLVPVVVLPDESPVFLFAFSVPFGAPLDVLRFWFRLLVDKYVFSVSTLLLS